jgi:hypothetical protein
VGNCELNETASYDAIRRDDLGEKSCRSSLWAANGTLILQVVPISFCSALFPTPLPLQNALERTPAFMATEALGGRTPGFCELFVTAGAIAARTEKILLGLPSHLGLLRQHPLSELYNASCAGGTALLASLCRERFPDTSAAPYGGATSLLSGGTPRCNTAATDAPGDKPDYNL